eukprot:CAMPEP_0176399438 /NCGR_PEP_ID=MMETSP0126-20121128/46768_1 /TAXON_ID=141414 ORGANISM="Strombidinopsis acuminatum, Strain SPMC142" /NCGR_SAMPLE_ID=MMETSP0126 /ASSEMBLY_ACC=CAM_ASM_000229 /LENGTH=30 /DNA_ID= /DNA_START= /DNA_END= /DNA_ORIENTATION=
MIWLFSTETKKWTDYKAAFPEVDPNDLNMP